MEIIDSIEHRNFQDPKYFSLHWSVTNNCNYKCDYCGVHKEEKIYPFYNILEFENFISNRYNTDVVLFGGEPLIHPNILQIIGSIKGNIRICTNLSRNEEFLRDIVNINSNIKIVASVHFANFSESFYSKINYLSTNIDFVKVKVMWDSRYKEKCLELYKKLKPMEKNSDKIKIYLDMVYHPNQEFTKKDIAFFESVQDDNRFSINFGSEYTSYNEIRRYFNGFPNFYNWKCYCGPKGLFIDSDGSVYLCQTKKNKGKVLFNVNHDDFKSHLDIFESPTICDEDDFCLEVVVPRRRYD
jgi:MoaA/NifB/PqqE/SkfB family radical SAM enzyme